MADNVAPALRMALQLYIQASRRTGRTKAMIDGVNDGDTIIVASSAEKNHIEAELHQVGKHKVKVLIVEPDRIHRERRTHEGRTHFDHTWYEAFWKFVITASQHELVHFQQLLAVSAKELETTDPRFQEWR